MVVIHRERQRERDFGYIFFKLLIMVNAICLLLYVYKIMLTAGNSYCHNTLTVNAQMTNLRILFIMLSKHKKAVRISFVVLKCVEAQHRHTLVL